MRAKNGNGDAQISLSVFRNYHPWKAIVQQLYDVLKCVKQFCISADFFISHILLQSPPDFGDRLLHQGIEPGWLYSWQLASHRFEHFCGFDERGSQL